MKINDCSSKKSSEENEPKNIWQQCFQESLRGNLPEITFAELCRAQGVEQTHTDK
jgi:hypothetical protein